MFAIIDTTAVPFPQVVIGWHSTTHGEDLTYREILSLETGKTSRPGLGLNPPRVWHKANWRDAVDVVLDRWASDGKPAQVRYELGGSSYRIVHYMGWHEVTPPA